MIAEKLRKAILQAAMQGSLTKQLPEDGDARDLLAEIQHEKKLRVKAGVIRATKPLPPIDPEDVPYEVPQNWVWTRIGEVTNYGYSGQINQDDIPKGSWVLELEDIEKNTSGLLAVRTDRYPGSSKFAFSAGDVLYGKLRPYLRKVIVATQPGFCSSEIVPFRGHLGIDPNYLKYFMLSPYATLSINSETFGTKMPRAGTEQVRSVQIPLPPAKEQKRLVTNIQFLMGLVNELEEDELELDVLEKEFPDKLKKSLLQAAMQGRLSEQLPEDGDARELLAEIQQEKKRKIKAGQIKAAKPLPPIEPEEIPYEIPSNWVWTRIGDLGEIVGGGTPKSTNPKFWSSGTIEWITPADMKNITGKYVSHGGRRITELGLEQSSAKLLPKDSIVYSSRAPIGYLAITEKLLATNQGFKSIVLTCRKINLFVYYALKAMTPQIIKMGSGTTFLEVSGSVFSRAIIPLPPPAEQESIVEILDELMPLCDELRKLKEV